MIFIVLPVNFLLCLTPLKPCAISGFEQFASMNFRGISGAGSNKLITQF